MNHLPNIVISARDLERLEVVLDALPQEARAASAGLREELARATFVDAGDVPPYVVTMNSIVRFTMPPSTKVHELRLCYPQDVVGAGQISVLTPVGTAMLGVAEGEQISWTGPTGKVFNLRVVEVVFQPERSGT